MATVANAAGMPDAHLGRSRAERPEAQQAERQDSC